MMENDVIINKAKIFLRQVAAESIATGTATPYFVMPIDLTICGFQIQRIMIRYEWTKDQFYRLDWNTDTWIPE